MREKNAFPASISLRTPHSESLFVILNTSAQWVGNAKFTMEWMCRITFSPGVLLEVERARKKKQDSLRIASSPPSPHAVCGFLLHGLALLKKCMRKNPWCTAAASNQALRRAPSTFFSMQSERETAEWFSQACIRKSKSEWMLRELLPLPGFCTRHSH